MNKGMLESNPTTQNVLRKQKKVSSTTTCAFESSAHIHVHITTFIVKIANQYFLILKRKRFPKKVLEL